MVELCCENFENCFVRTVDHEDWLAYSVGMDRHDELCYNFSISYHFTQIFNFPTGIFKDTLKAYFC